MTSGITCQVTGQVEEIPGEGSKEGFSWSTPGERAGLLLPLHLQADGLTAPFYRGED